MKTIIGVDPGANGGMAMIDEDTAKFIAIYSFSDQTVDQVVAMMRQWTDFVKLQGDYRSVYLEKVHQIKGDGAQGSFTFGKIYGGLLFGFKAFGMYTLDVPPMLWQSRLECLTGGEKKVSANRARQLFPGVLDHKLLKYVNSVADAMLIAEYGRRQTKGIR